MIQNNNKEVQYIWHDGVRIREDQLISMAMNARGYEEAKGYVMSLMAHGLTFGIRTYIYKVNNLLNSGGICQLLEKILLHNIIFPNTAYSFRGFAGYDGRSVMPVLKQNRIRNASPATQIMIDTYMSALGFTKENVEGRYSNGTYVVWDVLPRNVLVDADGDIYVVDAEIKKKE